MARGYSLTYDEAAGAFEEAGAEPLAMDEPVFRAFYARTARILRSYLAHMTGDGTLAEDLVQESYLRFLRAEKPSMDDAQQKAYLFRIASNLARDHFRSASFRHEAAPVDEIPVHGREAAQAGLKADLAAVMREMKPRHREMLWLAYAEGATHQEIADATGMKVQSVRPLLFRARQRLADLLRKKGFGPEGLR